MTEVVVVELKAVRAFGVCMLLDAEGKQIAAIEDRLACQCPAGMVKDHDGIHHELLRAANKLEGDSVDSWTKWAYRKCVHEAGLAKRLGQDDAWARKCRMWSSSHGKDRRNARLREGETGKMHGKRLRYFSAGSRSTWEDAFRCMTDQAYNRIRRATKMAADPWDRWADTCAGNHRKKASVRDGSDDEAVEGFGGEPGVQVCFEWN